MAVISEDYQSLVLDDMARYVGLTKPVRATILERLLTKKLSVDKLHPNPYDEFSETDVGPNYDIINNYADSMRTALWQSKDVIKEPIIVEKMSVGGYMILNGHHRWMAAHRTGVKKVPVQVVNVAPDEEIFAAISKSKNIKCVSIDLDEVLLADRSTYPEKVKMSLLSKKMFPKILRFNAGALINELRREGFDVWVYTRGFHSSEYINFLMKHQHTKVDGIVNGLSRRKSKEGLRNAFINKYKYSLHVDNAGIICVNNAIRECDTYDIDTTQNNWAADVMKQISRLKFD